MLCSGSVQNDPSFQHSFRIVLIDVKIPFTLPHYIVVYPRAKIQLKEVMIFFNIYSRTSAGEEQNSCLYVHSCTIQDDRTLQLSICGVSEGLPIYSTVPLKKRGGKKKKTVASEKLSEISSFSLHLSV